MKIMLKKLQDVTFIEHTQNAEQFTVNHENLIFYTSVCVYVKMLSTSQITDSIC